MDLLSKNKRLNKKLSTGRVLVMGCGGLGAASSMIIARAGIGFLRLVDRDFLDFDSVHHYNFFDEHDVKEGLPKAIAIARRLGQINSAIEVQPLVVDINRLNIEEMIKDVDIVISGINDRTTCLMLNEACVKHEKIYVYGAVKGCFGYMFNIQPGETPCLHCLSEKIPKQTMFTELVREKKIFVSTFSLIASIQCAEVIKFLVEGAERMNRSLVYVNLWDNTLKQLQFKKADLVKNCPVCNNRKFDVLNGRKENVYTTLLAENIIQIIPFSPKKLDLAKLAIELSEQGIVRANEYLIRFEINQYELIVFEDGRTIIKGTSDTGIARNLYRNYVKA